MRSAPPEPAQDRLEMAAIRRVVKHAGKALRQPLLIVYAEKLGEYGLRFLDAGWLPYGKRTLLSEPLAPASNVPAVFGGPRALHRCKVCSVEPQSKCCITFF